MKIEEKKAKKILNILRALALKEVKTGKRIMAMSPYALAKTGKFPDMDAFEIDRHLRFAARTGLVSYTTTHGTRYYRYKGQDLIAARDAREEQQQERKVKQIAIAKKLGIKSLQNEWNAEQVTMSSNDFERLAKRLSK
jgi:hypothetical protein